MRRRFLREVAAVGLPAGPGPATPVSPADLDGLPAPAQRYLSFMEVLGRPRDWSFRAHLSGRFRLRPGRWMACEIWQYNTGLDVARLFHMRLRLGGMVPVRVRDTYVAGVGRMRARILDVIPVVDQSDERIHVGELVTYLNDALFLAPSMLLGAQTRWTPVDDDAGAFDVALTAGGHTVTARALVDERGALTDFSTTDRFGQDPANPAAGLVRTRWTTPVEGWQRIDGRWRPRRAQAIWHFPAGPFAYADIDFSEGTLAYDVAPGR